MVISTILLLPLFLITVILTLTIPGIIFLSTNNNLSFLEKVCVGTILGLVVFSLLSYIMVISRLDFLIIPAVIIFDLLFIKKIKKLVTCLPKFTHTQFVLVIAVFIIGVIGQMAVIAPSGLKINNQLVFWSAHGHDGFWHIAVMNELERGGYPLQNPTLAGEKLVNYHFFSDIAPAIFNKYLHFSDLDLYFRFFPLIYSLLLGGLVFILGKKLSGSFTGGIWSVLFTYFAGSFGYLITLIRYHRVSGENIFWSSQIQSSIGNPPQIVSSILLLTFLYLFIQYLEKESRSFFIYLVLLAGSMAVFKVYVAVVLLLSLGLVGLVRFLRSKSLDVLFMSLGSGLVALTLYLPNTAHSTSFLIWEPWWFIRTMVVTSNHLDWLDLELRRQTYLSEHNFKRVLQLEGTAFLIFLFGNLGMRFVGFIGFIKSTKRALVDDTNLLLILISLTSFIFPLLFLQKGVAPNTIQFLQYFLLIFGIFAGVTTANLLSKIKSKTLLVVTSLLVITLAVPTQVGLLYEFYARPPLSKINKSELDALQFIRQNTKPNSIILTAPYNKYLDLKIATPPIWAWSDTAYVPALTNRKSYLTDVEQVDIMGYDYRKRLQIQQELFDTADHLIFKKLLFQTNTDYIYFPKLMRPKIDLNKIGLHLSFKNEAAELWSTK